VDVCTNYSLSADTGLLWLHAGGCILNVWGGGLGPRLSDSFFYAPRNRDTCRAPLMPLQLKPMERLCGGLSMFLESAQSPLGSGVLIGQSPNRAIGC
jgi:hypothetical protein